MLILKIILYILLALLILIVLALAVPTRLYVRYNGEIFLQLRYLFLKITIPITEEQKAAKEKKKKRSKASQKRAAKKEAKIAEKQAAQEAEKKQKTDKKGGKKKKKPNPVVKWLKSLYNKGGVEAIITAFKRIASLVGGVLKPVFKTFKLRNLNIDITSAADNAADAAINYGRLCAGVYPALSLILSVVRYNKYTVNIRPDFDKKEFEADISTEISVIPWAAVCGALCSLVRFVGFKIKGEI